MIIPIYDKTVLPCLTYPFTNTQAQTLKGFGGKGITQGQKVSVGILGKNDSEMLALYNFWKDDCVFGLNPFIVDLPMFGGSASQLVRFIGDLSSTKDGVWKQTLNLEILGGVIYIVDDLGNVILDDAGDFIVVNDSYLATTNVTTYKEITYA